MHNQGERATHEVIGCVAPREMTWRSVYSWQCLVRNQWRMPDVVEGTSSLFFVDNPETDSPVLCSPMTQHLPSLSACFAILTTCSTCVQER